MRPSFVRATVFLFTMGLFLGPADELFAAQKKTVKKKPAATESRKTARRATGKKVTAKRAKGKPAPKTRPTPRPIAAPETVAGPLYGPPTPSLQRAAGTCVAFEPGQYLMVAELGAAGRIFAVSRVTTIGTSVVPGARIRVLYEDRPEGPIAREILPGPIEVGKN